MKTRSLGNKKDTVCCYFENSVRWVIPKPVKSKGRNKVRIRPVGGFPGGAVVENLPANAGDMGSSPGLGRSHTPRSN